MRAEMDRVLNGSGAGLAPRTRLARAAQGVEAMRVETLHAVLAAHLADLDAQAATLGSDAAALIEMALRGNTSKLDPEAVLRLAERFVSLHTNRLSELRKMSDVLARMLTPQRPQVRVVAAVAADQVRIG